jgi:hypothetical protein
MNVDLWNAIYNPNFPDCNGEHEKVRVEALRQTRCRNCGWIWPDENADPTAAPPLPPDTSRSSE